MKDHWIVNRCPLSGSSFTNLFRLLWQNRFRIHIKYVPRLLYSLLMLLITWPLRIMEWIFTSRRVKKHVLPQDPIFIIGHWRSGTTLMHYLFDCDQSKGMVSNVEVYAPHFCLAFPRLARFLVGISLPPTRPMDQVQINAGLPGEEEHSLGAIDKYGYFHSMIFPRNWHSYAAYESFNGVSDRDLARWQQRYTTFIKKISLKNQGKQLVLKNPANTWRIKHLIKMYPRARFIHLVREPYSLMASSVRFYDETTRIFSLQKWDPAQTLDKMLYSYTELYRNWDQNIQELPRNQMITIRYEDMIRAPLKTMETVYRELGISEWDKARPYMKKYLEEHKTYTTHQYAYSPSFLKTVNQECGFILKMWKYTKKS